MSPRSLRIGILEDDEIGHEIVPASVEIARAAAAAEGLDTSYYLSFVS